MRPEKVSLFVSLSSPRCCRAGKHKTQTQNTKSWWEGGEEEGGRGTGFPYTIPFFWGVWYICIFQKKEDEDNGQDSDEGSTTGGLFLFL